MASFREINYAVRPAKSVERKMMSDGFRRLEFGWALPSYRYVGMGSVYFADFRLFHQTLGISDMVSIEHEISHCVRVNFNRPFGCVKMEFAEASEVLGSMSWDKRVIAWLDYDGKLDASVIADLKTVIQKAPSGSIVAVSVNVEADRPPPEISQMGSDSVDTWRLLQFEERVGSNLPPSLSGGDLRGKDFGRVCWRVLKEAVEDQIVKRNGRPDLRPDTMSAKQVFHFSYSDGAAMLTVAWLLYSQADTTKAANCELRGSFFRDGPEPMVIEAPKLTPKEISFLNSRLPDGPPVQSTSVKQIHKATGLSEADINKFAAVYRYYPQYGEVVL